MDKLRRNIVYIGSDSYYKDDLKLYDAKDIEKGDSIICKVKNDTIIFSKKEA